MGDPNADATLIDAMSRALGTAGHNAACAAIANAYTGMAMRELGYVLHSLHRKDDVIPVGTLRYAQRNLEGMLKFAVHYAERVK